MMSVQTRHLGIVASAMLVSLVGCSQLDGTAPAPDDTGRVVLSITNAPSDAACLRLTVKGATTAVRSLSLMTGASSTFAVEGLPSGAVQFTAEAFSVACSLVVA